MRGIMAGLPSRMRLKTGQVVALLAYRCATTCLFSTLSSISKGTPSIFSRSSRDRSPGAGDEGRKAIGSGGFLGTPVEPISKGPHEICMASGTRTDGSLTRNARQPANVLERPSPPQPRLGRF